MPTMDEALQAHHDHYVSLFRELNGELSPYDSTQFALAMWREREGKVNPLAEDRITFSYEGKQYAVDYQAYGKGRIVFPDLRAIEVLNWEETYPPKPMEVRELPFTFPDVAGATELAQLLGAVLAVEVGSK